VTEFGGPPALKQKLFVSLGGNGELPNVVQMEDIDTPLITEQYHEYFLDLKDQMPDNWSNVVVASKIPTSFDSTGKQVTMPFGIAPAALFYRADLFKKAGIDINSIVTWEDFIEAGKKLQAALPNTKMVGFSYTTGFSSFIRAMMLQQDRDYFDQDGKIAIYSKEGIEAAKMMQRLVNEGIAFDTTDWTGTIRASKTDDIASIPYGIWWGGTLKDQAPEMK
ncbi:extracellular solute-binding protein, partial [Brachyspira hampsonii]|nr:extracellular solute-binding protein [Brachyspira hampsonii]